MVKHDGSLIQEEIAKLAAGSRYDADDGGKNEAWAGALFEACGIDYLAFDLAKGYKTEIFDLNSQKLNRAHCGALDLIMNCGTTEHFIGQFNVFTQIHDACKVGGYINHQLPHIGWANHGYFTYTGRFFFDMAGHNKYEVIAFWYDVGGHEPLLKCTRD